RRRSTSPPTTRRSYTARCSTSMAGGSRWPSALDRRLLEVRDPDVEGGLERIRAAGREEQEHPALDPREQRRGGPGGVQRRVDLPGGLQAPDAFRDLASPAAHQRGAHSPGSRRVATELRVDGGQ